jgi:hypothetical protein
MLKTGNPQVPTQSLLAITWVSYLIQNSVNRKGF